MAESMSLAGSYVGEFLATNGTSLLPYMGDHIGLFSILQPAILKNFVG
jgi:hypothetical protein